MVDDLSQKPGFYGPLVLSPRLVEQSVLYFNSFIRQFVSLDDSCIST